MPIHNADIAAIFDRCVLEEHQKGQLRIVFLRTFYLLVSFGKVI